MCIRDRYSITIDTAVYRFFSSIVLFIYTHARWVFFNWSRVEPANNNKRLSSVIMQMSAAGNLICIEPPRFRPAYFPNRLNTTANWLAESESLKRCDAIKIAAAVPCALTILSNILFVTFLALCLLYPVSYTHLI